MLNTTRTLVFYLSTPIGSLFQIIKKKERPNLGQSQGLRTLVMAGGILDLVFRVGRGGLMEGEEQS